jgi:hypothetical protein
MILVVFNEGNNKFYYNIMQSQLTDSNSQVRRDRVLVSRSLGNYWWATALTIGSIGFLVVGFSSFIGFNILPFVHAESIQFLPQGLVISFYGALGLSTAAYLWLAILWKVGDGYNEFNKIKGTLRLFRWGFPGTQRRIDLSFPIQDIEGILIRQDLELGNLDQFYVVFQEIPNEKVEAFL